MLLCYLAIGNFEYIHPDLQTMDMYMRAISNNCETLKYVPQQLQTIEMYIAAFNSKIC